MLNEAKCARRLFRQQERRRRVNTCWRLVVFSHRWMIDGSVVDGAHYFQWMVSMVILVAAAVLVSTYKPYFCRLNRSAQPPDLAAIWRWLIAADIWGSSPSQVVARCSVPWLVC